MCIRKGAGNQHRIRTQHFIDSNKFATQQQQHTYLETNHHPCFRTTTIPAPPALEICAKTTYQRPANRAPWMNIFAAGRQIPPATAMQRSTHLHLGCGVWLVSRRRRAAAPTSSRPYLGFPQAGFQCDFLAAGRQIPPATAMQRSPHLHLGCGVWLVSRSRRCAAPTSSRPYLGFLNVIFFAAGRQTKSTTAMQRSPRSLRSRRRRAVAPTSPKPYIGFPPAGFQYRRVRVGVESYVVPLYMWIFLRAAGAVFNRLDFKSAPAERSFHVLSQISTPFKQDLRLHFRISSAISSDSDGRLQILTLELVSLASKTQKLTLEVDKSVNKNSSRDKRSVRVPEEFKEHNEEGQGGRE
ncbi:hypothetical protein DFH06DRAFT_1294266 [Mycena polygramma]|nr:hypothetical protein DFH06DRAFT_1294259 [Mycena polygramma]KAJ7669516.1 hypothetical protein DFH06DRAFT_1294266 [Mycena polygramma]